VSSVAPAGSVVGGLFILVSYAGFASPLVVVVAFVASLCCASSIAEFARRLPSAGSLYTYNSSPASSPHGQFSDITNAMIYGISAFAGFEAAAALGEEARDSRRSIPAATIAVVIVTGVFYLLVVLAETFGAGRHGITGLIRQPSPLGYLTSRYWSPSVLWAIDLVVVLTGLGFVIAVFNAAIRMLFAMGRERVQPGSFARLSGRQTPVIAIGCAAVLALALGLPLTYADGGQRTFGYLAGAAALSVVLIYLAVNIAAIRAFRTEFRDQYRLWGHLLLPAAAAVLFLFRCGGSFIRAYTLVNLLPFVALGWLCLGVIAAGVLRPKARTP
jgi:amino acid transporter